jgi:hypothetical protein
VICPSNTLIVNSLRTSNPTTKIHDDKVNWINYLQLKLKGSDKKRSNEFQVMWTLGNTSHKSGNRYLLYSLFNNASVFQTIQC